MSGSTPAIDEIFSRCYPELKRLAHARLAGIDRGSTLDTAALVHDVYVRLASVGGVVVESRPQFMAYAARTMRSLIVDIVRARAAEVHGGQAQHVALDTDLAEKLGAKQDDVLEIHRALEQLGEVDDRLVRVVEMRYFAGFSQVEVAQSLDLTERTVRRDWQRARVLLAAMLAS